MSRLELYSRPLVVFDAANKDHRKYYYQFMEKGAWGHCPYRFIVPDDYGNLITMIQRKLIEYYINKEFRVTEQQPKPVAKKPQTIVKKVSQKRSGLVDFIVN